MSTQNTIPWREAFPEYTAKEYPAVCLRGTRYRESLTQRQLAVLAEIPQARISLMECGKMVIGATRAKRLAKALNTGYRVFL